MATSTFLIYYSQPGGMSIFVHDRGKLVGKPREFKNRSEAEAVAAKRALPKAVVVVNH